MKKCTNCGQAQNDDVKFCFSCGGGDFEPVAEETAYQQPAYQQPAYQQPAFQQPAYQQPAYQQPYQQPYQQAVFNNTEPVKISTFLIFFLLMLIPIYNIIHFIMVAIGGPKHNVSLTTFARAALIWSVIIAAIYIILILVFGVAILSVFRGGNYYF